MAILSQSVRRIKSDLMGLVPAREIQDACLACGHTWRERVLDPVTTVHLFILQVLHGNTSCTHVRQLGGYRFQAPAYCEARKRLPRQVVHALLVQSGCKVREYGRSVAHWFGHQVWLIDGSSFSMSDEPELVQLFGYPGSQKPGCGFPTAHVLAVFDLLSGALVDMIASSWRTNDMTMAHEFTSHYRRGDIVVADRAFCSFGHLSLLLNRGVNAVFRAHQTINIDFTPGRAHCNPRHGKTHVKGRPRSAWVRRLGREDQVVDWFKPKGCPTWLTPEQFELFPTSIRVRELRYRVRRRGFRSRQVTIVTTLLDRDTYPKSAIVNLYGRRWQVEINLRHLKQTMSMDVLRCRTADGVIKELMMFGVVYNTVRFVMLGASIQQGVSSDRISFVDVLRWITGGCVGTHLPTFVVNPIRERPPEPRVRKRRPKNYDLMTRPRSYLRKRLKSRRLRAN
jgi:hypothetical protein